MRPNGIIYGASTLCPSRNPTTGIIARAACRNPAAANRIAMAAGIHSSEEIVVKQPELYERFRALHEQDGGVVMPNAWDGVSALLLKQAGFMALGSSSAAIAFALGRLDGVHAVSRAQALENAALLGRLTGLPINGDLEDGFGPAPED